MNVAPNSEMLIENVLPLFDNVEMNVDPLRDLIIEGEAGWPDQELAPEMTLKKRIVVGENQFPDQSMYVLDKQISNLKGSLERLKFYLSDLDDLLPP